MDSVRELAMKTIFSICSEGAYANVALSKALRLAPAGDADRRFLTELVYGTAKAWGTLDWMIECYSSRPVRKMPPFISAILRMGFFQLFFLDKVPASAATNESVNLAKKYGHAGTARFVNAVMRSAVREPEKAALPKGHDAAALALSTLHPKWLIEYWIDELGYDEARRLAEWDNEPHALTLRTNTLKTSREALIARLASEGVSAAPSDTAPEGIAVMSHGSLESLPSLREGLFQVQGESSMQVAHVLSPKPGDFVIDACAAPGGKATHIAALMKNRGLVLALDVHEHKLNLVRENAARLGTGIVSTALMDAREIGEKYREKADRVLVDAPCSGLGVLGSRPDARWRKKHSDIAALSRLQSEILECAARSVRPGGVLVYSTCTTTREENEDVVAAFLSRSDEFSAEDTGLFLPVPRREVQAVRLYPQRDGMDGFFMVRMRRRG